MTSRALQKQQTKAIAALLQALPDLQLDDVLATLEAHGRISIDKDSAKRRRRVCGICGKPFVLCRDQRLADDDHEFEASER